MKKEPEGPLVEFSDDDRWRRHEADGGTTRARRPIAKLVKYPPFQRFRLKHPRSEQVKAYRKIYLLSSDF